LKKWCVNFHLLIEATSTACLMFRAAVEHGRFMELMCSALNLKYKTLFNFIDYVNGAESPYFIDQLVGSHPSNDEYQWGY